VSKDHQVQTSIAMAVPTTRGGDGNRYVRLALLCTGQISWEEVLPAPPRDGRQRQERAWELRNGFDWSEPRLEPAASKYAGCWASHAIVKGTIELSQTSPPTFSSTVGDLRIFNSIDLTFWPQGKYMPVSVTKLVRDLSQPLRHTADLPDGDQLPPYSM